MNRKISIFIVLLTVGAGGAARAEDTNAPATLDWSYFEPISQKNIFDPSRGGRSRDIGNRPRVTVIRTFTFRGTMDDRAIFTGEGVPTDGCAKVGDLINGFKVMQVTIDDVKLAQPNGDLLVLQTDDSMRREDDSPWAKSDQPPPPVLTVTTTTANSDTAPTASAGGADTKTVDQSEILKRLRLKREQENK